jgi:hypothetical protein
MDGGLTAEDLDWLRILKAAADLKRDPPLIPANIAAKLVSFGLAHPAGPGGVTITPKGLDALLDQDMRDAEDR